MATASGGFVARAERQSIDLKTTSPAHVGPGAYNLAGVPSQPTAVGAAAAPFSSSQQREICPNTTTSAVTPGPGAYAAAQAHDAVLNRTARSLGYSAPFASGTARIHDDKAGQGKPGPGEYDTGNGWVKHRHHYAPRQSAAQRVSYLRTASAPSIPARDQSYGYEEGPQGRLVMQRPQDPVLTGVGRDTVGPGAYDLAAAQPAKPKAVVWGASRTRRGLQVKSDTPGPGAYNLAKDTKPVAGGGIVVSINGVDVQFGGASGTSAFASRVPLNAHKSVQEWERTPGPGAYNSLGRGLGAHPLPRELQFFGSSARRGSEMDPRTSLAAPTYMRTPGPGAYDPPPGKAGPSLIQAALSDPKPFNSTNSRFGRDDNGIPGPGEYRPDATGGLAYQIAAKAAISKGGVFGANAPRFSPAGAPPEAGAGGGASSSAGPGAYDPKPAPDKPLHKGHSTVFASKTDRFRAASAPAAAIDTADYEPEAGKLPRGDPARLGPGAYTLPDQWARKGLSYKQAAFGSESGRSKVAAGAAANLPGPGRYNTTKDVDKALKPMTNPGKETVFGSQVARFKTAGPFTPGPGQYNLGADLTRKSYNITYNGVTVA